MFKLNLGICGKAISKELLDSNIWIMEPAFYKTVTTVKQVLSIKDSKNSYQKFLYMPTPILSEDDEATFFQVREGNKIFNLIYCNAFYDLNTGTCTNI